MPWSLVAVALLATFFAGCGGAEEAPPAPAPVVAPAPADDGMASHMADMARTRDGLRAALGDAYDQPVAGLDTADKVAGKALYDQHCAPCHGLSGRGDGPNAAALKPPPSDFTDAFHARYYSDAGRMHIIANGAEGTAMASFSTTLSDTERLNVYAFVRSLRAGTP